MRPDQKADQAFAFSAALFTLAEMQPPYSLWVALELASVVGSAAVLLHDRGDTSPEAVLDEVSSHTDHAGYLDNGLSLDLFEAMTAALEALEGCTERLCRQPPAVLPFPQPPEERS